ncbi:energy transducer TonB [Thalassotalea crassostreae]|uniref:energy transducer TonB n=1 Tax=Thalassotalea crassostreae TaxID=1763536 RepID=UPI0008394E81|nr:energy transducer TonB [Thalassotalea crassostreae]
MKTYKTFALPLLLIFSSFQSAAKPTENVQEQLDVTKYPTNPHFPIVRVQPNYPEEAYNDGITGVVILRYSITTTGKVEDVQVVESSPKQIFDKAAKKALSKWRYKPSIENGQPVKIKDLYQTIEFTIEDDC